MPEVEQPKPEGPFLFMSQLVREPGWWTRAAEPPPRVAPTVAMRVATATEAR